MNVGLWSMSQSRFGYNQCYKAYKAGNVFDTVNAIKLVEPVMFWWCLISHESSFSVIFFIKEI